MKARIVFAFVATLLVVSLVSTAVAAERSLPEEVSSLLQRAQEKARGGELEKAESDSREALGIALDQLGGLYSALGRYDDADKAYHEAVQASVSASSTALMGLSILEMRRGEYAEGIQTASKILELNPFHAGARHVLGKIRFLQGDFQGAATELQDSHQIRPDDISVAYTLGLTFLKLQKVEAARELFAEMTNSLGDSARLHVLFGRALRATDFLDEAIAEFKKAIQMDSTVPRVHSYLGVAYLMQKDAAGFPEAIPEFEAEIANDPNSYFGHFYLGVIYSRSRQNEKAAFHLREAARADPGNPDPYLHLGQTLFQKGDFEAAAAAMRHCIELTKEVSRNKYQVANAHYVLGRSLLRLDRMDEAKPELALAQELKSRRASEQSESMQIYIKGRPEPDVGSDSLPDLVPTAESGGGILEEPDLSPDARTIVQNTIEVYRNAASKAYEGLARVKTLRDDYRSAARFLRQGLAWDDSLVDGYFNLGLALFKSDDLAAAVEPLIEACRRNPQKTGSVELLANAALKLVELHQPDAASKAVTFLLESNPQVAELWLLKGHVAAQKGRFDEAVEAYRQALGKNPSLPEAHYSIGTALIREADFDSALREFDAELTLNPSHAGALYHKAYILLARRQTDEAVELLNQVVRLDRDYADAYYQLGKVQLEQGQLLLAQANLETAAHLKPDASYVFFQLSKAYGKANRPEDAKQAFERYRSLKKAEEESRLSRTKQQPPER